MHPEAGPAPVGLGHDPDLQHRLGTFVGLVEKWNPSINLVSRDSLPLIWSRHIEDSLQLLDVLACEPRLWLDMGSGGGFPGAVVAIAARARGLKTSFVLAESDQRKAAFLRTVSRETGAGFEVLASRIEDLAPQDADVVSARALAPLTVLCGYANRHLSDDGVAIFPKGQNAEREVAEARNVWQFDLTTEPSRTDPNAKLLVLRGLRRA